MKTSVIIAAVLTGVTALTFASSESNVSTASFDPGKFYGLVINSNANVILTQGEENTIRVEGDKKDLKNITAEVENGALVVRGENKYPVNIYVSAEELSLIEINGSARLFGSGSLSSDILLLKINGNGSMKIDIRALTVGMIVKGTGKIIVSGSSGDSYSRIMGTGTILTDGLDTFNLTEERIALSDDTKNKKRSTLKLHQ